MVSARVGPHVGLVGFPSVDTSLLYGLSMISVKR